MSQEVDVLITIRKIIRATDLYSRQLSKKSGLTAPQLLVLQAIQEMGAVAISRLSTHVSLSQATVTSILDRLEGRGLVSRHRSTMDKRVVHGRSTFCTLQDITRHQHQYVGGRNLGPRILTGGAGPPVA